MENNKIFALISVATAVLCGCGNGSINDSINKEVALNKRTFISFPVEFKMLSTDEAKSITNKSHIKLNNDLSDVFADWKTETCQQVEDKEIKLKCENNEFDNSNMFVDSIQVGKVDLNKDGKSDLILYLGGKTGRAGLGDCGVAEYRFYKNIGKDFILIGRANTTQNAQLNILDNARKNQFMSLIWKYQTDCEGKPFKSELRKDFNISSKSY